MVQDVQLVGIELQVLQGDIHAVQVIFVSYGYNPEGHV